MHIRRRHKHDVCLVQRILCPANFMSVLRHKPSGALPTLPPYFELRHTIFQEAGNLNSLQATSLGSLPPVPKVETPSRTS